MTWLETSYMARNGVAKAALLADGQQWAGQPIKVETEFLIRQRIMPSLAAARPSRTGSTCRTCLIGGRCSTAGVDRFPPPDRRRI